MIVFVGGGEKLKKVFLWNTEIKKIYVGDKLVYWGYQEVEYIWSSGSQYIDTMYSIWDKTNFSMEFTFTWNITADFQVLWGVRAASWNNEHCSVWYRSSDGVWYVYWGSATLSPSWLDFTTLTTLKVDNNKWYLNWVQKVSWTNNWTSNSSNLYIFARNYNWFNAPASVNMYNVKFWEWEVLVRDFVPCYRKSDNVIWMYDKVNKVFYTNSGSGSFTKWPDV